MRFANRIERFRVLAWLLLLAAIVTLVYWPGLGGGFVFDDFPNIVDNIPVHVTMGSPWNKWLAAMFSSPSIELQRPLAMLSFAMNHAAGGLDPYWMKLTNVFIHALNAWLVFGLARRIVKTASVPDVAGIREDRQALWISAAWALNPINLMAVLFIVQRMESLSHTFVFAGLWMYLAGRERLTRHGHGWGLMLAGLAGGTALGMLAKESAALLPLYALALEWALLRFDGRGRQPQRGLMALYAVVLVVPAVVALAWQLPKVMTATAYAARDFTLGERLLTEARVLVDYLHWTVLPNLRTLSLYHDDFPISHGWLAPASTLASTALLVALLGLAIWIRRRRPLTALGIAWFFIAHLLTGTILPLELVYEHRNYFASLGVCLVLGDLLLRLPRSESPRRISQLLALLLLVFYAGLTTLRANEWHDVLRFATTEAAKHPQSPRATYDLARDLVILSNYDTHSPYLAQARTALERAMRVPGASTLPEAAAIIVAARTGAPTQAAWWDSLQRKLRANPIGPQETASLASMVDCDLRFHCNLPPLRMTATFFAALERGDNAEMLNIYGNYALNRLHDPALALRLWQDAARRAPNVVEYQLTLAKMLIAMGKPDMAAQPIERIRALGRFGQNEAVAGALQRSARERAARIEAMDVP
jgi:hypothetical protein